jgi:hypothetical protein
LSKRIGAIHLARRPTIRECHCQEQTNGTSSDCGTSICFKIINSL